ncbi:MAG: hypothetical protein ACI9MR_004085 [Myxococcota bacterium]|jgi:hypothetical protein
MVMSAHTDTAPRQQARILWQLALDGDIQKPPMALADGVLIIVDRDVGCEVRRVSLESEGVTWRRPLDTPAMGQLARSGHVIAVPSAKGELARLSLADGTPLKPDWEPANAAWVGPLKAHGGRFYGRSGTGKGARLSCYVPGQRKPLWMTSDPLAGSDDGRLNYSAGRLLLAGNHAVEGMLVTAFAPGTGEVLWTHRNPELRVNRLWAIGGIIDVVTHTNVVGLSVETGEKRTTRFAGFPLETATTSGGQLVAMMEGHMGPVLLSFDMVSQNLAGRVSRAIEGLIGAHPAEVMVQLAGGEPALYTLPGLETVGLPEADALQNPRWIAWARDVAYVVAGHGRSLTALDLNSDGLE